MTLLNTSAARPGAPNAPSIQGSSMYLAVEPGSTAENAGPFRMAPQPTSALLHTLLSGGGLPAVTEAIETLIDRPVIILDASVRPLSLGSRASAVLDNHQLFQRAAEMSAKVQRETRRQFEADTVVAIEHNEPLGIASAQVTAVRANDRLLGYVVALGSPDPSKRRSDTERQILLESGSIVAIELIRFQSIAEAEARVFGGLLWEIGSGRLNSHEIVAKSNMLGISSTDQYSVVLGQCELLENEDLLDYVAEEALRRGRHAGLQVTVRGNEILILVPEGLAGSVSPWKLIERSTTKLTRQWITWGIDDRVVTLNELYDGLSRARRTAEVGRALSGPGSLSNARALQPFFMLANLAQDPETVRIATTALEPLTKYDANRAGDLTRTLEVFLDELGNTSSAARRLFLNRHSLIYRLRKIEELTGRCLDRAEDRLILDLSLKLCKLAKSRTSVGLGRKMRKKQEDVA